MHIAERIILCLAGLGLAVLGCTLGAAAAGAPLIVIPSAFIGVAGILAMMASVTR